jgi:hypothetical protein
VIRNSTKYIHYHTVGEAEMDPSYVDYILIICTKYIHYHTAGEAEMGPSYVDNILITADDAQSGPYGCPTAVATSSINAQGVFTKFLNRPCSYGLTSSSNVGVKLTASKTMLQL